MSALAAETGTTMQQKLDMLQTFVMHHMADSHVLRLPFLTIQLPDFISLHGLTVILTAFLLIIVFGRLYRKNAPVPHGLTNLLELFVVFVRDEISVRYLGPQDGRKMTPLFCSYFFFILALNLVGLVPSFYTATANPNVTGALAAVTLGFMIFGAMYRNGPVGFVKGFIPRGVPWPVVILLLPIEFLSLFIKAFALMIRLFANELSGHIVAYFMIGLTILFGLKAAPLLLMALFIYFLEVVVAFLQAYIFTLLSAIFIGQQYHPEH